MSKQSDFEEHMVWLRDHTASRLEAQREGRHLIPEGCHLNSYLQGVRDTADELLKKFRKEVLTEDKP